MVGHENRRRRHSQVRELPHDIKGPVVHLEQDVVIIAAVECESSLFFLKCTSCFRQLDLHDFQLVGHLLVLMPRNLLLANDGHARIFILPEIVRLAQFLDPSFHGDAASRGLLLELLSCIESLLLRLDRGSHRLDPGGQAVSFAPSSLENIGSLFSLLPLALELALEFGDLLA